MLLVSFYVTEKKVGDALWALEGIAQGKPEVTLIRGAKATANGHIKSTVREGSIGETVAKLVHKSGKQLINSGEIQKLLIKAGGSKKGIGSMTAKLRHMGIIRGLGQGKGYEVLGAKAHG